MTKQFTFMLVKSHMYDRPKAVDLIFGLAEKVDLTVVGRMQLIGPMPRTLAEALYEEHRGRPYYDGLIHSVTFASTTAGVLVGDDAIAKWRALLGATDPTKAEKGTIRGDFGLELPNNCCHSSDSVAAAHREVALFYSKAFIDAMGLDLVK